MTGHVSHAANHGHLLALAFPVYAVIDQSPDMSGPAQNTGQTARPDGRLQSLHMERAALMERLRVLNMQHRDREACSIERKLKDVTCAIMREQIKETKNER